MSSLDATETGTSGNSAFEADAGPGVTSSVVTDNDVPSGDSPETASPETGTSETAGQEIGVSQGTAPDFGRPSNDGGGGAPGESDITRAQPRDKGKEKELIRSVQPPHVHVLPTVQASPRSDTELNLEEFG